MDIRVDIILYKILLYDKECKIVNLLVKFLPTIRTSEDTQEKSAKIPKVGDKVCQTARGRDFPAVLALLVLVPLVLDLGVPALAAHLM
jgi:hypothetical protein